VHTMHRNTSTEQEQWNVGITEDMRGKDGANLGRVAEECDPLSLPLFTVYSSSALLLLRIHRMSNRNFNIVHGFASSEAGEAAETVEAMEKVEIPV